MVAAAKQLRVAPTQSHLLPSHLLSEKKSPIAQKLAMQEQARLERAQLISRHRTVLDQNLRLVNDRPLIETARCAKRSTLEGGVIDAYSRRTQSVRMHRSESTALVTAPTPLGRSSADHYREVHRGASLATMNIGIRLPEMHVHPGARLAIASLIMLILVLGTYGTGLALGGF